MNYFHFRVGFSVIVSFLDKIEFLFWGLEWPSSIELIVFRYEFLIELFLNFLKGLSCNDYFSFCATILCILSSEYCDIGACLDAMTFLIISLTENPELSRICVSCIFFLSSF